MFDTVDSIVTIWPLPEAEPHLCLFLLTCFFKWYRHFLPMIILLIVAFKYLTNIFYLFLSSVIFKYL